RCIASSEETLRSPDNCRPAASVVTKSSGDSIPLFMQVGVVRMRPLESRTDKLPSQATIYPRSYNQRPATQISRACCASLFSEPGKSESGVKGDSFLARGVPRRFVVISPGTLRSGVTKWPVGSLGPRRAKKKLIQN